ncbi:MAG: Kae1-associated serine/threonine protein kinase [archaeon]|nr:Kae1-associated serine/threonine protein kinase [archaeon]MCP8306634.1 Kae1-associated serine/threonine protein kinase [archaeon]
MERLIRKGAEADIYLGELFGRKAILKIRKPKPYRQPDLDSGIRKRRTLHEASFLVDARKAGVSTPLVYFIDPDKAEIVMQYIKGKRLKEIISDSKQSDIDTLYSEVGRSIAKLHKDSIIHGDLTTSNFLVIKNDVLVFIDFGLAFSSQRLEDKAVDLHLMKEALTSAHSKVADKAFSKILEGYSEVAGVKMVKDLVKKVREIERRGRYTRVE